MIVARLDVHHSRRVAPTRRVAVGDRKLPLHPAPGFGGILLAGIVATQLSGLDPDLHRDLDRLIHDLRWSSSVPQPRLRHRLQVDRVGLTRSRFRLRSVGQQLVFNFDAEHGAPEQYVLGAVYAAAAVPQPARSRLLKLIGHAMAWMGLRDQELIAKLAGRDPYGSLRPDAADDPVRWALGVFGFEGSLPDRQQVTRRFRELLRGVHPDLGGTGENAGERIAELTEARRILYA